MRFPLLVLVLAGCGAASPAGGSVSAGPAPAEPVSAAPAPTGPPAEMTARVFLSLEELGPLASLVDPSLDLAGRALVLPGAALPARASAVHVVDASGLAGASVPAAIAPATPPAYSPEQVFGQIVAGTLALSFVHDIGACCSGIDQPDLAGCGGLPPLPPVPVGDDVVVWLFVVPREAATGVTVTRTESPCEAQ